MKERRLKEKESRGWLSWLTGGWDEEPDIELDVNTEEGKGQGSGVRGQGSEARGQGPGVRDHGSCMYAGFPHI